MAEGSGGVGTLPREVFLDTGYLLALERRTDQNHPDALGHWRSLRGVGPLRLVSTTYVFDETVTYLNSRGLHASAVKVGERLLASPSVEFVQVGEGPFREAFGLLGRRPDKRYSLTDCVSFVVMRERGIGTAVRLRPALRAGGLREGAAARVRVGYIRISKKDQNPDLQRREFEAFGCKKIFEEQISSREAARPELRVALEYCREGDKLVVWKLDRFGRSLKELIELVNDVRERGIEFVSLRESLDTTTTAGAG